ncbi:electron transfer flavoprotein beta subunit/FixA family protein [Apibacter muscae]|uniref:electron transfer flavoprotein subunit beta/FixA family protein n=1 Tax=Apibacter muscae TaxID=2509004 RepID=UPI0011ABF151|nr:electron transfer flavoprotein subunit beta/FixA family protein [Apibacter muscae]TWP22855.1 electron transfer flavoprotein beta subunit/FixA family protein [Apibacter muscae]
MKILVAISAVPDTTSKINFNDNDTKFDKSGVQFIINPLDEYCVNKALQFQENHQAEVSLITVGEPSIESVMRKALALGINEAIRVNIEPTDSEIVAHEIATIAEKNNYDLLLLGKESLDFNGAAVPGLTAALLGYNFVNDVISINILDNNKISVVREFDNGVETIELKLPVVLAGKKGLVKENEIKIPTMRGIMAARTKKIIVEEAQNIPSKLKSIKFEKAKARSEVRLIDPNHLDELVNLLHDEAKVI